MAALFGDSILKPQAGRATLDSFQYSGPNLKVICQPNGDPLDPNLFDKPCRVGEYQNTGSWPLFTGIAEKVRQISGLGVNRNRLLDEQLQMKYSKDAEWRNGLVARHSRTSFDGSKTNHAWNVLAKVLIREMLAV